MASVFLTLSRVASLGTAASSGEVFHPRGQCRCEIQLRGRGILAGSLWNANIPPRRSENVPNLSKLMKHLSPPTPSEVMTHGSHTPVRTITRPGSRWLPGWFPGCLSVLPGHAGVAKLEEPLLVLHPLKKRGSKLRSGISWAYDVK